MTGIVKVGTGFGQFVIPLVVSVLIASHGWRFSYIALGAGTLVIFTAIALLIRREPPQTAESGSARNSATAASCSVPQESLSLKDATRSRAFWIICASNLLSLFCLMSIMVHIVPHAGGIIASPTKAAGILSTIGFVSMGGRILTGFVIDRLGTKRSTIFCYVLLALTLLWLQVADKTWMLYLFAAFYGIAHGGLFTIISPIVADYFGIKAHGLLFGIVAFCGTIGGALGPLFSGYIFDLTGSYYAAFWMCTGVSGVGLLLMTALKPAKAASRG